MESGIQRWDILPRSQYHRDRQPAIRQPALFIDAASCQPCDDS
jgi:hypothetical protein